MMQPLQAKKHGKYNDNGKGLYLWFDDDKMSYKYILLIT